MHAYWLALEYGEPGEVYNIGGITTMTVGEVLTRLVGMARGPIPTRLDSRLLRPVDVTLQIPNTTKFERATGWKPRFSAEDSLHFLLDYWRQEAELEERRRVCCLEQS